VDWVDSFIYLVLISIIAFPIGRSIPKKWLRFDRYPFKDFRWENGGKVYHRFAIREWQDKVPDMSKIMKKHMKRKSLPPGSTAEDVKYLLDETCVAEVVHALLCVAALYCIKLWRAKGGIIFYFLYVVVFNLPYILLQRYNRPRLARLYKRMTSGLEEQYNCSEEKIKCGERS